MTAARQATDVTKVCLAKTWRMSVVSTVLPTPELKIDRTLTRFAHHNQPKLVKCFLFGVASANRFFERKFGLHFQILMGAGEGIRDSGFGV